MMEASQSDSAPPRRTGTDDRAPGSAMFLRLTLLAISFLLLATIVGVSFIVLQGRQLEEREYSNLESIARLKANRSKIGSRSALAMPRPCMHQRAWCPSFSDSARTG